MLTKEQILEIYLNQIFLGRNAYGVQAAARAYFNKDVRELSLAEFAYLAILPKAPSNYDPVRHRDRALERRNWVLGEMARNGFITAAQRAAAARASRSRTIQGGTEEQVRNVNGYFMEEVRRELVTRFGENADPRRIRTASMPAGSGCARPTIRGCSARPRRRCATGWCASRRGRGWRDSGVTIDINGDWRARLAAAPFGAGYPAWREAVVLGVGGGEAQLGFVDGTRGRLPSANASMPQRGTGGPAFAALRPGTVIAVERQGESGDTYALRSIPEISGAIVVEEVGTGRVLAMQGGFDYRLLRLQPRHPGAAPAGIDVQAVRLCRGARRGHDAGLDHRRRAVLRESGRAAGQKCFRNSRRRLCRPADDALGRSSNRAT